MTSTLFLAVLASAFLHATWNACAKKVSGDVATLWLGLVIAGLMALPFSDFLNTISAFGPIEIALAITAAVINAVYISLVGHAYKRGDISLVYPVVRGSNVAGALLFGSLLLSERLSILGIAGIATILGGTLLITGSAIYSSDRAQRRAQAVSLVLAIVNGVLLASGTFFDKFAVQRIPPPFYLTMLFGGSAFVLLPWMLARHRLELRQALTHTKRWAAIVGIGSLASYGLIVWVFSQGGALSYVVALREFSVALGAMWGFLVLEEPVTRWRVGGVIAIVLGLVAIRLAS